MQKALALQSYPRPAAAEAPKWLQKLERTIKMKSRKFRRPRVISIEGVKLEVDRSRLTPPVVRALYRERYEDKEAQLVREVLMPGDRVLEIGAGIGFISLLCAKRCGPEAVLSYEANPDNETLIRRNFELNGLRPQLRCRAISVESDDRELFVAQNILSTSFIDRGDSATKVVKCDAISNVIEEFRPNSIVMDVEGAEIDLLPAAPLDGVAKIILETHARIVGDPAIRQLDHHLLGRGFVRPPAHSLGKVRLYLRPQSQH
jgi:FkbM family methyltransferase